MSIAQAALSLVAVNPIVWRADWRWGVPIIVSTILIHVFGLSVIYQKAARVSSKLTRHRHTTIVFMVLMGTATLSATALLAVESGIWAVAYLLLGALPNGKSAMLYSLSAITSYGHANLILEDRWQLMGAIEALNGVLLFGLTTAFLFAMIQRIWLSASDSVSVRLPPSE